MIACGNEKMIKISSAILIICLLFSMIVPAASADDDVLSGPTGDCTWTLNGSELTISGTGDMADYDDSQGVIAPWGKDVTKVIFESGVNNIGSYSFYNCTKLTEVVIPYGMSRINAYAFRRCSSLRSITIPTSVVSIGFCAFGFRSDLDLVMYGSYGSAASEYAESAGYYFKGVSFILGDADCDGKLSVMDATAIQRRLVQLPQYAYCADGADADSDGIVTVIDATAIQRHLAGLRSNEKIGKLIDSIE